MVWEREKGMSQRRPIPSDVRVRAGEGPKPSVDGHPGWVRQSVRQYGCLCALALATQGYLAGVGVVLDAARSAAWWVMLAGAAGGLLVWLPVWGMMRGPRPVTSDEAFCEAYGRWIGGALSLAYLGLLLFNAVLAIRAAVSVVKGYLLPDAGEIVLALAIVVTLAVALWRHGEQGLSRTAWLFRTGIVVVMAAMYCILLGNARAENLFPPLGRSVGGTLSALPVAAGSFSGILVLGQLPRETGSAQPVRLRTGAVALLVGGLCAAALMLLVNLCVPPRVEMTRPMVWGRQLLLIVEYVRQRVLREAYIFVLVLSLVIGAGASLVAGSGMAQGMMRRRGKWPLVLLLAATAALCTRMEQGFADWMEGAMAYRLPLAAIPAWVTWGVLAVRRRRRQA
ncbi:hypothetical protein FACS1894196_1860 [Clostridia bacterium]|nr:hypothetical protein FACS1894196_1770 [Clostridia bacterium]GHU82858.1 hypothetical protein FACS1894196_1860 [Clostridia bacterium]